MISDEIISVVADVGNLYTRAGFTGDDCPRYHSFSKCTEEGQFGEVPLGYQGNMIDVLRPMNFDLYEKLIKKCFDAILVEPKDYSLLLANNFKSKQDLCKITERIFEKLNVPNFFTIRNAVLSTFSAGRSSALVLDIGAYQTTAVAVHDGYTLLKQQTAQEIGGESLNEFIMPYVPQQPNQFKYQNLVRDVKESLLNYESNTSTYELPDGTQIAIPEAIEIADKLFSPKDQFKGLQHMLIDVVNNSPIDLRQLLCSTLLATGGSSNIPGFLQKLNTSFSAVGSSMCKIKLIQYPSEQNRQQSVFIGGSILASLSSFQSMWIGKPEYQEMGNSILDRKCPM